MIFTQEMIEEIKHRLSLAGIKDTEIRKVNLLENPLKGDETLVIVKEGENVRISLEDLYEDISKYIEDSENREDFFNVSVYLGRLIPGLEEGIQPCTLEEAINACPSYIRRVGETITFLDSNDDEWKTYQMSGKDISEWDNIDIWKNYHKILQDQIDDIISSQASVSIVATPSTILTTQENSISILASTNREASNIVITGGNIPSPIVGSGTSLSGNDSIPVSDNTDDITYNAVFTISGKNRSASCKVSRVYPIYYGSAASYSGIDDFSTASARKTPAGNYNVVVSNSEDYVYFVVPSTMNISKATMNGFDFPLQAPVSVTIEGIEYKYYKSSNTYDAGTLNIVIS